MGQIFKILAPGETSDLYDNAPESVSQRFITHFGRPTAENFNSGFLTKVRPNGSSFPTFTLKRVSLELDASGTESFSPGFFTRFGRPMTENYESVFLLRCDQMGQVSKFYQFSVMGLQKWVKNPGR